MDAGPMLNVNGPNGGLQLAQASDGSSYSAMFGTSYLDTGGYEVDNGGGGNDVEAFQAVLNSPASFQWTNQSSGGSVAKNVPLTITWRGGDPNGVVLVLGLSQDPTSTYGAGFSCAERSSVGTLTIPTYVLSWMTTNTDAISALGVTENVQSRFSAPGLDAGYLLFQIGQVTNVRFTTGTVGKM
jgi:hypothetical protein